MPISSKRIFKLFQYLVRKMTQMVQMMILCAILNNQVQQLVLLDIKNILSKWIPMKFIVDLIFSLLLPYLLIQQLLVENVTKGKKNLALNGIKLNLPIIFYRKTNSKLKKSIFKKLNLIVLRILSIVQHYTQMKFSVKDTNMKHSKSSKNKSQK